MYENDIRENCVIYIVEKYSMLDILYYINIESMESVVIAILVAKNIIVFDYHIFYCEHV